MKRRDFLKLTAAGVVGLVLPVALIAPALGAGWRQLYVITFYADRPVNEIDLASHNLTMFARHMEKRDLTEITGYSHKIAYHPDRDAWVVTAQAKLR